MFKLMGQEFIACNNMTDDNEIARLTGYCLMLDKYLKSMNLYAIDPSPLLDKYNALPKSASQSHRLRLSRQLPKGLNPSRMWTLFSRN